MGTLQKKKSKKKPKKIPKKVVLITTNTALKLATECVWRYCDLMTICLLDNNDRKEDYEIRLSISVSIYEKFHKIANQPFPPTEHRVTMELYEAMIVQKAIVRYMSGTENDFGRNALETFKLKLNQKIVNIKATI